MSSILGFIRRRLLAPTLATVPSMTVVVDSESSPELRRHDKYWLDDGSVVLRAQNDLYKVHRTLLYRHSRTLASLSSTDVPAEGANTVEGLPVVYIPDNLGVRSRDVEALLEHLYHDA